jgi:hypothetical protein
MIYNAKYEVEGYGHIRRATTNKAASSQTKVSRDLEKTRETTRFAKSDNTIMDNLEGAFNKALEDGTILGAILLAKDKSGTYVTVSIRQYID